MNDEHLLVNPIYIYDPFLIEYINKQSIVNFMYVETKTAYNNYMIEREKTDAPEPLAASIKIFNRAIRDRFPTLDTRHISKKGVNMYIWMVKGD